jgi:hypothetical protein
MKKLLALGFLSLAALAWATAPASAWWPCGKCCSKCCTTICVRQYNAFTPICCGNLCCTGCCPMTFGGCGMGGAAYGDGGTCMMNAGTATDICGGQLPAPGMMMNPGYQALPAGQAMGYANPMQYNPYLYASPIMQPNTYQAMYGPQAMMPSAPNPFGVPYYWNNGR